MTFLARFQGRDHDGERVGVQLRDDIGKGYQTPCSSAPGSRLCLSLGRGDGVDRWTNIMALTIGDRVAALRNRSMANPAFHRWAFSVPGVRAIALRHTREVFDLCAGFVYSQVLLACVKVRLFEMLAEGPLTPQDITARCGLPLASVERLLKAAASLRLVEERSAGRLGLGQRGAAIAADPSIGAMIEHHATLYADLADPVALLSSDKPKTGMAAYWPYAGAENPGGVASDQAQTYSALMATSQGMISAQVLDAYDFTRHRCLLDVGGGSGAFVVPVARRAPNLTVRVFRPSAGSAVGCGPVRARRPQRPRAGYRR